MVKKGGDKKFHNNLIMSSNPAEQEAENSTTEEDKKTVVKEGQVDMSSNSSEPVMFSTEQKPKRRDSNKLVLVLYVVLTVLAVIAAAVAYRVLQRETVVGNLIELKSKRACKGENCMEYFTDYKIVPSAKVTFTYTQGDAGEVVKATAAFEFEYKVHGASLNCISTIKGDKSEATRKDVGLSQRSVSIKHDETYHHPFSFSKVDTHFIIVLQCKGPIQELTTEFVLNHETLHVDKVPHRKNHWITAMHYLYYLAGRGAGKTYLSERESGVENGIIAGVLQHNNKFVTPRNMKHAPLCHIDDAGFSLTLDMFVVRAVCSRDMLRVVSSNQTEIPFEAVTDEQKKCKKEVMEDFDSYMKTLKSVSSAADFDKAIVNHALDVLELRATPIQFVIDEREIRKEGASKIAELFQHIAHFNTLMIVVYNRAAYNKHIKPGTSVFNNDTDIQEIRVIGNEKNSFVVFDCGTALPEYKEKCLTENQLTFLAINDYVLRATGEWIDNLLRNNIGWLYSHHHSPEAKLAIRKRKEHNDKKLKNVK